MTLVSGVLLRLSSSRHETPRSTAIRRPPKGNDAANAARFAVEKSMRSEVLALPSSEWPKIESWAVERKITSSYGVDSRPLLGRLKDASRGGVSAALPSESTRGARGESHLRLSSFEGRWTLRAGCLGTRRGIGGACTLCDVGTIGAIFRGACPTSSQRVSATRATSRTATQPRHGRRS